MFRLIVIGGLLYFGYRKLKAIGLWPGGASSADQGDARGSDDMMVQDPVCGTYFPRREGVRFVEGGTEFLFCSTACLERFKKDREAVKKEEHT